MRNNVRYVQGAPRTPQNEPEARCLNWAVLVVWVGSLAFCLAIWALFGWLAWRWG